MFKFIEEKIGFKSSLKKLYSGEDVWQKHMILFLFVAVPAMISKPFHAISSIQGLGMVDCIILSLYLIATAAVAIYLGGYLYGVIHNSFNEDNESILPDFDKSWFRIFFKGFPIQLVWFIYLVLIYIVSTVAFALIGSFSTLPVRLVSFLSIGLGFLVTNLLMLPLPLIYAQFAEKYERKGLYNPILPYKYMIKAFKSFLILILVYAPIFIFTVILGFFGLRDSIVSYLLTAVWAYLWTMLQYSANYCYVQIYKREIK